MFPYLAVLSIPAMLGMRFQNRLSAIAWAMVFFIYLVFIGLRYEIGPDWLQYEALHQAIGNSSIWTFFSQTEPLSNLLFWISYNSVGMALSNVFAAFCMLLGTFAFALRTANPWLAVASATPYFLFVVGMSGIRQGIAAGIMLFLLSRWERYHVFKRLGFIITAALFHTSALVNTIFLVTQLRIPFAYKLIISALTALITFFIGSEVTTFADSMMSYQERYIENAYGIESLGTLYHIGFVAIPAFAGMIYYKEIRPHLHNPSLFVFGATACFLLFGLNFISSTMTSRLTIYLYFVPMMVLPALTMIYQGRVRKTATLALVFYNFAILIIWFTFSNHNSAYIPYGSMLF